VHNSQTRRTRARRDHDRAEIARRYLTGEPQSRIAAALGLSRSQVRRDLGVIRERWKAEAVRDYNQAVADELARLGLVESEAWAAWERSKEPLEILTGERIGTPDPSGVRDDTGAEGRTRATRTTRNRDGNPAFLQAVQHCIDQRIRLLKLGPPMIDLAQYVKPVAERFGLDPSEVLQDVYDILREHGDRF
jgi:hypothetical protein